MKIAAMTMVTLYIIYWAYNNAQGVLADECWQSGGQRGDRVTLSLLVVLPNAIALAALVYLWSTL